MDMRKVSQHAHALMARFVRRGSDDSLFFWTFVVFETTPEKLLPTCKCRMQQLNKLPVQGTLSRNHLRGENHLEFYASAEAMEDDATHPVAVLVSDIRT